MKTISDYLFNTLENMTNESEKIIKKINFQTFGQNLPENEAEIMHRNIFVSIANSEIGKKFTIDSNNREIIVKLWYYFTGNNAQCENLQIDLNKGLLLIGCTGSGKSVLIEIFRKYTQINRTNSFQSYTAQEIIDNTGTIGRDYIEKFTTSNDHPIVCYIDDIAAKIEKIKHYGSDIDVISELISHRYNVYQRFRKLTHFSSNIYPAELGKIYDERIISRLSEMCNIIELTGKDRRI